MKMQYTLTQSLNANLNITPQFVQAIHILQMPSVDLMAYLQEQCLENPLMEVVIDSESDGWNRARTKGTRNQTETFDRAELVENHEETLEMMLISQLRILGLTGNRLSLASYLAGNLNENGYLALSIEEVCEHLQEPMDVALQALNDLQSLEPWGIGARSLQECLLIQIRKNNDTASYVYEIVDQFMNELASAKFARIAESLQISIQEVKQALSYIQKLNPRPGLSYTSIRAKYVEPDAYIQKNGEGYMISLNNLNYPKVTLNSYGKEFKRTGAYKEVNSFVSGYSQSAKWIIRCIEQRKETLLRVIEAIAEEQRLFLEYGKVSLKPMNLKAIAVKLELHESTISRAIAHKYVQTPLGIYELKSLFSNGLMTSGGEVTSSESIKLQIRNLIETEDKKKPFSDKQITDKLISQGVQISRRTVMKYREEMQIVSSRLRSMG